MAFIERNTVVYFDSFGIEYIPQEVLNKIRDKPIPHNIFRIEDNESNNESNNNESVWILLYCFHRIYACRKKFIRLYLFILSEWL